MTFISDLIVKMSIFRHVLRSCQSETAIAICTNHASIPVRRRVIDPNAGKLDSPKTMELPSSTYIQPASKKGSRAAAPSPSIPTSITYALDSLSVATQLVPVTHVQFLSYLQQKHRNPKSFMCIDLIERTGLKYALLLNDSVAADIRNDVTLLIIAYDVVAYERLLHTAHPKQTFILDGDQFEFFKMYPFCHTDSPYTMPGPTEILSTKEKVKTIKTLMGHCYRDFAYTSLTTGRRSLIAT
eukprot:Blabericola_migrator_1__9419@NODE_5097_length_875_cov_217_547030_g164_i3_p1_GENE_NODE_5097_length_875_cov_217_547030_g164_i3NODE_5097_length_875_cov_217_547030_g164_i3_p1_ORF_typecomplete_len241_score21_41_NODE_5097_length_875_cov_217_547030_g164_i3143865